MFNGTRSRILPAILGMGLLGGSALAQQPGDGLKQFETKQSLYRQQLEADVATTIDKAGELQVKSPKQAINLVKAKIDAVKGDTFLSEDQRKALIAKLNAKIDIIEGKEPKAIKPNEDIAKRRALEEERAKAIIAEVKEMQRELDTIKALADSSKLEQARKQSEALLKKYPNNPAAIALNQTALTADSINEAKILSSQMREGYLLAMRTVDKSAIPIAGDIQFDEKVWKEVVSKRLKSTLTPGEKKILKALDTPYMIDVKDKSFEAVLNDLSESLKIPIILDEVAKSELKIDSSTTVTVNLKGVETRTALRKILADKGLAFVMKKEHILVTTQEKAKNMLVSRVYYVGDLVSGLGAFNSVRFGPLADQRQTQAMVDQLTSAILAVDPMSWERDHNGGHGTVAFHWPSMSFIIRQSAEVHAKLGSSLGNGQ